MEIGYGNCLEVYLPNVNCVIEFTYISEHLPLPYNCIFLLFANTIVRNRTTMARIRAPVQRETHLATQAESALQSRFHKNEVSLRLRRKLERLALSKSIFIFYFFLVMTTLLIA